MRQKKLLSCSSILQSASASILERGRELARLNHAVRQLLPDDLAVHCQVMNFRDKTLILGASSAARATQLRFMAPELRSSLQHSLSLNIETIKIRVLQETVESKPVVRRVPALSANSANLLAQTAQTVDHPELQEALYRIAAKMRSN